MGTAEFARLLLTLHLLLQQVEREGLELPPIEELLRFANAQTNLKVGEKSLPVSNETPTKATSISTTARPSSGTILDDKRPVEAAGNDQQSPLMSTPVKRSDAVTPVTSPTRPVPSTQGRTKHSGILSPVTPAHVRFDAEEAPSPTGVPDTQVRPSSLGPTTPTPAHQANSPVRHFSFKQSAWQEDPDLAQFLSFKNLEEIALGHKLNGFVCSNCNYYNRVGELEDEE